MYRRAQTPDPPDPTPSPFATLGRALPTSSKAPFPGTAPAPPSSSRAALLQQGQGQQIPGGFMSLPRNFRLPVGPLVPVNLETTTAMGPVQVQLSPPVSTTSALFPNSPLPSPPLPFSAAGNYGRVQSPSLGSPVVQTGTEYPAAANFLGVPQQGDGVLDTPSLPRRFKSVTHGAYRVGRKIGEGTLAVVREAVNIETGQPYALKILPVDNIRGREHRVKMEIEVLKRISMGHPNVISLYDYFTDHKNLFLVMDLCTGGDLYERVRSMGPYTEDQSRSILTVVVRAVKYLHDNNVVHRDLKAENILFRGSDTTDAGNVVIADFGLSSLFGEGGAGVLKTMCGTPGWMAPEIVVASGNPYGKQVDLWSVGVLAYFLVSGMMPFESDNSLEETMNVAIGKYEFGPAFEHVSSLAKDFIRMLLIVTPALRMTAEQALQHPFLNRAEAERILANQRTLLALQLQQQAQQAQQNGLLLQQQMLMSASASNSTLAGNPGGAASPSTILSSPVSPATTEPDFAEMLRQLQSMNGINSPVAESGQLLPSQSQTAEQQQAMILQTAAAMGLELDYQTLQALQAQAAGGDFSALEGMDLSGLEGLVDLNGMQGLEEGQGDGMDDLGM